MALLLLTTVAEITTLFSCHSVGQITGASPYHELQRERERESVCVCVGEREREYRERDIEE